MMEELSSYPSCPKPTSINLKECHEWIVKYESFLHKLHSAWSTQHKQVMQDILRPFSSSMMEDVFVLHRRDSACRSPEAEDKIRSILILTGKLKISAPLEPDDPEEVYSAYSDHSSLCARLRSSRCRRKDSRSWWLFQEFILWFTSYQSFQSYLFSIYAILGLCILHHFIANFNNSFMLWPVYWHFHANLRIFDFLCTELFCLYNSILVH